MSRIDKYLEEVITLGDEGSELLAKLCSPTLKNSQYVDVLEQGMNGLAVLRIPEDYMCVVHSCGGDPTKEDLSDCAQSLVSRLMGQAKTLGVTPIGFANVIDSNKGDKKMLETIAHSLVSAANRHSLAILNGENAILGARVNCEANLSGTMISMVEKTNHLIQEEVEYNPNLAEGFINVKQGVNYAVFDPQGKAIFINSDGIGTKTEFYERASEYSLSSEDSMAMRWDDANKVGAIIKVDSEVIEIKGDIPFTQLSNHAEDLGERYSVLCIRQIEKIGDRLCGYSEDAATYNLSGSVVSVIDEERLRNPLRPNVGEEIVAIRGKPNPRSNGITDKRKIMVKVFGENWHQTTVGKLFLEYLATPSTIMYPLFRDLIEGDLATSVYHLSGGSYNGKLARPLAKHNLFAAIDGESLFQPDWRELAISGFTFTRPEDAYQKWPMGTDGFITTSKPERAIQFINQYGLEARKVSTLEKAKGGKTGVELIGIKDSKGQDIYYTGK